MENSSQFLTVLACCIPSKKMRIYINFADEYFGRKFKIVTENGENSAQGWAISEILYKIRIFKL